MNLFNIVQKLENVGRGVRRSTADYLFRTGFYAGLAMSIIAFGDTFPALIGECAGLTGFVYVVQKMDGYRTEPKDKWRALIIGAGMATAIGVVKKAPEIYSFLEQLVR